MPVQQRIAVSGMQVFVHHRTIVFAAFLSIIETHITTVTTTSDNPSTSKRAATPPTGPRLSGGVA